MFDPKSDYALNKTDQEAIVYIDSSGTVTRLTRACFASAEEFLRWKTWSDTDYHELEKANHIFSNHTVLIAGDGIAVQSAEDILVAAQDHQEHQELVRLLMSGLDNCLTPTQRRRLWLSCVCGLTVRQISQSENANFQNVAKSIAAAKKKLKKILAEQGDKTPF